MRKTITEKLPDKAATGGDWLDLEQLARVEVSSEEVDRPVEAALLPSARGGWRAEVPGEATLCLRFDTPQRVRRIQLLFLEEATPRTQEFVLSWSKAEAGEEREIVRQQFTFSPPATVRELEDYRVELDGVRELTLRLIPQIGGGPVRASLEHWRIGA